MKDENTAATRRAPTRRRVVVGLAVVTAVCAAGVAVGAGAGVKIQGSGGGKAKVSCPGGMSRLGHEFNENMSIFPYDPAIDITNVYTLDPDGFQVEAIRMGAPCGHAPRRAGSLRRRRAKRRRVGGGGVHLAGALDRRARMTFTDNFVEQSDIEAYEDEHGKIFERHPAGGRRGVFRGRRR